jgi:hypothetical protein
MSSKTATVQEKPRSRPTDQVQYLKSADEEVYFYATEPGVGEVDPRAAEFKQCKIEARNGRVEGPDSWDLDKQGFKLVDHVPKVKDWQDDDEVKEVYYKEAQELILKHVKGAKRVEVFDHTRRSSSAELRKGISGREPSNQVHNDYTDKSATKRLHEMIPEEAEELSKRRFAIVNIWRSIAGKIECSPLAFVDSTSINADKDLISVKRISKDRVGELQMALFDKEHRWYYFPGMNNDECVLFKTFDSSNDVNQFTLHTSLQTIGNKEVPRQSIEIRAFVFF